MSASLHLTSSSVRFPTRLAPKQFQPSLLYFQYAYDVFVLHGMHYPFSLIDIFSQWQRSLSEAAFISDYFDDVQLFNSTQKLERFVFVKESHSFCDDSTSTKCLLNLTEEEVNDEVLISLAVHIFNGKQIIYGREPGSKMATKFTTFTCFCTWKGKWHA